MGHFIGSDENCDTQTGGQGWAYEMDFIHSRSDEIRSILLGTGSALVISGEARYDWLHQIKARKSDGRIDRQRRVSLTFRNVIVDPQARR